MSRRHSGWDSATFTIGAEAANAITVNVQLTAGGADVASRQGGICYLSSDANGDIFEPDSSTLSWAVGTDGMFGPLAATDAVGNTFGMFLSEADGDLDIVVTQTSGADTIYLVLITPDGPPVVSAALTFAA